MFSADYKRSTSLVPLMTTAVCETISPPPMTNIGQNTDDLEKRPVPKKPDIEHVVVQDDPRAWSSKRKVGIISFYTTPLCLTTFRPLFCSLFPQPLGFQRYQWTCRIVRCPPFRAKKLNYLFLSSGQPGHRRRAPHVPCRDKLEYLRFHSCSRSFPIAMVRRERN